MRKLLMILGLIAVLCIPVMAQTQQKQQIGPVEIVGYKELTIAKNQVIFSGKRVYIHTLDGRLEAKSSKIVVTYASGSDNSGTGSLKTIALTGDVWLKTKPEAGRVTEATAEKVDVDWATKKEAVLSGDVKIKSSDPSVFIGPAVASADKAIISLKPESQLADGESRLRIISNDENSKIEFTPKEAEQSKSANKNR